MKYARETVDFEAITDRCIERFESIEALNESRGNNIFTRSAKRLRQIKAHLETQREQGKAKVLANSIPETVPGNNQFLEAIPFDDDWLRDIMEPWDYQFTGMENQSVVPEGQDTPNGGNSVLGILLRSP